VSGARIRLATKGDVAALANLRRAWVEEYAGAPIDDDRYESDFADWYDAETGRRTTWLATVGAEAVGMLNLTEFRRMPQPGVPRRRWGYIANVFVRPARRDLGIGKQLLDAALAEAAERGYVRLVLSPSAGSMPFYRRAGFVPADSLLVLPLR
jgi:GNAT superfamily N-acetyltransferase